MKIKFEFGGEPLELSEIFFKIIDSYDFLSKIVLLETDISAENLLFEQVYDFEKEGYEVYRVLIGSPDTLNSKELNSELGDNTTLHAYTVSLTKLLEQVEETLDIKFDLIKKPFLNENNNAEASISGITFL